MVRRCLTVRFGVSLCLLLGLSLMAGCGGDADTGVSFPPPPPGAGPEVHGTVSMPNGRVAQLQPSALERLAALIVAEVRALTAANVEPVGRNNQVTLGFLRDDGLFQNNLAHVFTDDNGSYARLFLPTGTTIDGPGGRFLVSVGAGDALTRAFVCSSVDATNINFNSEAAVRLILEEVAANPLVRLTDFSPLEICQIVEAIVELPGDVVGNNAAEVNFDATRLARMDARIIDLIQRAGGAQPTPTPRDGTPTVTRTNTPNTPVQPTATPTTPVSCPATMAPTPSPTGVQINVNNGIVNGSNKIVVEVTLVSSGESVGGMQNDIVFDNRVVNLPTASACVINPAIGLFPNGLPPEVTCSEDTTIGPCKSLSRALNNCGESPLPPGCPAADANLTRFRGIIAATAAPNSNEIPDGVLYTCTFDVVSAAGLPTDLENGNIVVSDPTGARINEVTGTSAFATIGGVVAQLSCGSQLFLVDASQFPASGNVLVDNQNVAYTKSGNTLNLATPLNQIASVGEIVYLVPSPAPSPTPTNTQVGPPTATFTATPTGVNVDVGIGAVNASNQVVIQVTLSDGGVEVGGVQNDIVFDNTAINLPQASRCVLNDAIGMFPLGLPPATSCSDDPEIGPCKTLSRDLRNCGDTPVPQGCPAQDSTLSRFRAIIAATATPNDNPIPDGLLYTCTFDVVSAAQLPSVLDNMNIVASDPLGDRIEPVFGNDGLATIGATVTASAVAGATSITVDSAASFPASGFLLINNQLVSFTKSGNTLILGEGLDRNAPSGTTVFLAIAEPPTPTATQPPTNTPVTPTNTPVTPTATDTPVTPTSTPVTPTATNTPETPTSTPVTPTATNTEVVPTATPTSTPVTPTSTPPPTPTATSGSLPSIDVGSASGLPGTTVNIAVTMSNSGGGIVATGTDIIYDPTQVRVARTGNTPMCTIDPAIGPGTAADKGLLRGIALVSGGTMERVRVGVINSENANVIPDGPLFSCVFEILPGATLGAKVLANTPSASSPAGTDVIVGGADGTITVNPAAGPSIDVGSASGAAGTTVNIAVTMSNSGGGIVATGTDIIYDPTQVRVARTGNTPMCTIDPAIGPGTAADKGLLRGIALVSGGTMERVRVGVINSENANVIPDGPLFSCVFEILPGATLGAKVLANTPSASSPAGTDVIVDGQDGAITVTPPAGPSIDVSSASGGAGTMVTIAVTMSNSGGGIVATGTDIIYDQTQVRVARTGNTPMCTIDPSIGPGTAAEKGLLRGIALVSGGTMERVRVGVINSENANVIPDGPLFSCVFEILAGATPGAKVLANTPSASSPAGTDVVVTGASGSITVQ